MRTKGGVEDSIDSPARIFVDLWLRASQWDPSSLLLSGYEPAFADSVASHLEDDNEACVTKLLRSSLPAGDSQQDRKKIMAMMRAIDIFFSRIHPRTPVLPPTICAPLGTPQWLANLKSRRKKFADYGEFGASRLIARGPLSRHVRAESESSAVNFADMFSALEVVPKTLDIQGRTINISHKVAIFSAGTGTTTTPGKERVVVVPLAEKKEDLILQEREEAKQLLIRYQIRDDLDAAQLFANALSSAGKFDIAIAPEFVMPESEANKIPNLVVANDFNCRLIVAGSGLTIAQHDGLPWNETQVFDGLGVELWRQRKIWPAGIGRKRAEDYNISTELCSDLGYEDTASGNEIVIVDIDGLGRCVVLICQDIEGQPFAAELLRQFQPDWIFTPILDPGISEGNWVHQRAFALSKLSHARFVIASSTSLARRMGKADEPTCALAVGPLAHTDEDKGRQTCFAQIVSGSSPGYAAIEWREGDWKKTSVGTN